MAEGQNPVLFAKCGQIEPSQNQSKLDRLAKC